jgi:hypothetical protein
MENEITEVTRRAIVDYLATGEISWCGRFQVMTSWRGRDDVQNLSEGVAQA